MSEYADLAKLRLLYYSEGVEKLNSEWKHLQSSAEQSFGSISRTAGLAMGAVGVAVTGALGLATREALKFDEGMRDVATLGVTNFQALRDGVLDYSAAMGKDAYTSTKDLYQILSKGVSEANAIDALTISAEAAAMGVGEVSDALDLGTSVLNAYGLEFGQMEGVLNSAVQAVKYGSTTIGEMGSVIGRVAPLASQAGMSFEELFASIAAVTSQGTKTSEAISGLKAAMTNVIKPSDEAAGVAKALGIEFNAAGLQSKGWAGFMADLTEKVSENSPAVAAHRDEVGALILKMEEGTEARKEELRAIDEQIEATKKQRAGLEKDSQQYKMLTATLDKLNAQKKDLVISTQDLKARFGELRKKHEELQGVSDNTLATMASMFGSVEALNTALALASESGGKKFAEALQAMEDGTKSLHDSYMEWAEENPGLAMKMAKAEMQKLAIEIGTTLLPVLADLAHQLVPILQWVSDFIREHPKVAGGLIKLVGGFGLLNLALAPVIGGLSKIIGAVKFVGGLGIAGKLAGLFGAGKAAASGVGAVGAAASSTAIEMVAVTNAAGQVSYTMAGAGAASKSTALALTGTGGALTQAGAAATTTTSTIGGLGLTLSTFAAGIGGPITAIGAGGVAIAKVGYDAWQTDKAWDAALETIDGTGPSAEQAATALEALGVTIDRVAMAGMTADEKGLYLAEQKQQQLIQQYRERGVMLDEELMRSMDFQRRKQYINEQLVIHDRMSQSEIARNHAAATETVTGAEKAQQDAVEETRQKFWESVRSQVEAGKTHVEAFEAGAEQFKVGTAYMASEWNLYAREFDVGATEIEESFWASVESNIEAGATQQQAFNAAAHRFGLDAEQMTAAWAEFTTRFEVETEEAFQKLPEVTRRGWNSALSEFKVISGRMKREARSLHAELRRAVDPTMRHSPSINDLVASGWRKTQEIIDREMSGIERRATEVHQALAQAVGGPSGMPGGRAGGSRTDKAAAELARAMEPPNGGMVAGSAGSRSGMGGSGCGAGLPEKNTEPAHITMNVKIDRDVDGERFLAEARKMFTRKRIGVGG